jgi:two-component system NtrC family sensor kinase
MNDSVLIVDDSLTVRMDLVEAFEAAGFRPHPCPTLADAREAMARDPAAVIVLDVLLPDGDGVDFLRELRASPRGAAASVLVLSTDAAVQDRVRGLQTGADEYVGKPYDTGYVVARARELLRARHASASGDRASVLVIDDSLTFRETLRHVLEAAGYTVFLAASGEDGLRAAADRRPGAILVDGVLPGIDGPTVIRRIRLDAALRRVPCLLLTAADDSAAELRALDAGADAFVRKEEEAEVILARLAATLRAAASTSASDDTASLLGPKKILAVDDSMTYLHALGASLRGEGYDVALALSGAEALELLAVQPVDCILLDLLMPGLSGQETCQRIKAAPIVRDIPLIMLTALEDREAMIAGLGAGADDYISKSSEFDVLKARVRAQIRRKQFEDENRRIREELLRRELEAVEARAARELAETRAALVDELERKNRELETFSYSVSHDLRSPLRAIDGFSQAVLEEQAGKLNARGEDYLRRIRANARRMGELIDDLLSLSRFGRAELKRRSTDLSELARTIARELAEGAPARRVEIEVQDGLIADADSRLMRVVLDNLLGNAWKFTARVEEARVQFGAAATENETVYFVRDNGAGFDMRHAERLFGAFQRLHDAADFPGTGIGLATVLRIIDRHGGRVWADSAVGRGATFSFTLPPARPGARL